MSQLLIDDSDLKHLYIS